MSKLHGYHCNTCGAWLMVGEVHTCDPKRLEVIDRIADFFGRHATFPDPHEEEELKELLAAKDDDKDPRG